MIVKRACADISTSMELVKHETSYFQESFLLFSQYIIRELFRCIVLVEWTPRLHIYWPPAKLLQYCISVWVATLSEEYGVDVHLSHLDEL